MRLFLASVLVFLAATTPSHAGPSRLAGALMAERGIPDPTMCVQSLDEDVKAALVQEAGNLDELRRVRAMIESCRAGYCSQLAEALHDRRPAAAAHLHVRLGAPQCAIALWAAACNIGNRDACTRVGTMYLSGAGYVRRDRANAIRYLSAACELGGECTDVRSNFYARHILALSAYFGLDNTVGNTNRPANPLGGEVALLRFFGDWKSSGGTRGVVLGAGAGAQAEYAFGLGQTRVGGNLAAVLWTVKLRAGYMAALDAGGAARHDLRFDLATSAPWVQAPLRMTFRVDVPLASRDDAGGVRLGFFVEVGHNFGLDGRSPRLRDFGFPLFF
jgi:hypothetical protein